MAEEQEHKHKSDEVDTDALSHQQPQDRDLPRDLGPLLGSLQDPDRVPARDPVRDLLLDRLALGSLRDPDPDPRNLSIGALTPDRVPARAPTQDLLLGSLRDRVPAPITPTNLANDIAPYLQAVSDLQHIVDEIGGRPPSKVKILSIVQGSITATVGGVTQAIEVILSVVIPWRYKHAKKMAQLAEGEKQAQVEVAKAQVLAHELQAHKDRKQAQLEFDERRANLEHIQLENEKLRVELHREKIQLALDVLEKIQPGLPETERIHYVTKLLEPLNVLATSELDIKLNDADKDDRT